MNNAFHSLSPAQLGVWFDIETNPRDVRYNTADYLEFNGLVDHGRLEAAICEVIASTSALRLR